MAMMNNTKLLILSLAVLPMILLVGCASDGSKKADNNSESYLGATSSEYVSQTETVSDLDTANLVKSDVQSSQDDTETADINTPHQTAADESTPKGKVNEQVPMPTEYVFQFRFDKADINKSDKTGIRAHAEYLLAHPNLLLAINGHTDSRGPKVYNDVLSEKRAEAMAKQLIAYGVPESQLITNGHGADNPITSENNWQENRRVELEYSELFVVSK